MRTLVLNAGYEPLAVVSFKRALVLVMNDKATIVEHIEGDPIWGSSGTYERPAVIVLTRYVRVPPGRHVPVTRRGVLRRDGFR
ncbi:MAG: HNH endonuclease, partial [Microbacterium sp.]|nr:HNH endonuclease [Microbacterium sp.]